MGFYDFQKFVNVFSNQSSLNLSSIFSNYDGWNSSLEITGRHIEPLVNQRFVENILSSIKFILSVGKVSNDSVGWEECSLWSLKQWKGIEWRDGAEISGSLMGNFFNLNTKGINDSLDFLVPVTDSTLGAIM